MASLVLSFPLESTIKDNQQGYYQALEEAEPMLKPTTQEDVGLSSKLVVTCPTSTRELIMEMSSCFTSGSMNFMDKFSPAFNAENTGFRIGLFYANLNFC